MLKEKFSEFKEDVEAQIALLKQAIDLAYDGKAFYELSSPIIENNNNGAGCTFASSIAANMAYNHPFKDSVKNAKDFVYQAIQNANEYGVFQNKK